MLGKPTMIFVDAQNLHHGKMSYGDEDYRMDDLALRDKLAEQRDLIRSYWFDSFPTEEQIQEINDADDERTLSDKESFFTMLRMNGFRVDAKPLRKRGDQFVEKGADTGLVTELVAQGFNDAYDVAVVVSGDSDFERSIRHVQDQGKVVEVASFERTASTEIKRVADTFHKIDDFADEIEYTG